MPAEEYARLAGTELEGLSPSSGATVLVVEEEGAIVGTLLLGSVVVVEGLWIAPAVRSGVAVARLLWRGLQTALEALGVDGALAGLEATDPAVRRRLARWLTPLGQMGLWRRRR